jgi:hypothetical protein
VKRIGKVAYKLDIPPGLIGVHPVFHVSQLRKWVVVKKRVPAQALDVQETLEYPVRSLDWADVDGVFWYTKHVHYTLVWIWLWN